MYGDAPEELLDKAARHDDLNDAKDCLVDLMCESESTPTKDETKNENDPNHPEAPPAGLFNILRPNAFGFVTSPVKHVILVTNGNL